MIVIPHLDQIIPRVIDLIKCPKGINERDGSFAKRDAAKLAWPGILQMNAGDPPTTSPKFLHDIMSVRREIAHVGIDLQRFGFDRIDDSQGVSDARDIFTVHGFQAQHDAG